MVPRDQKRVVLLVDNKRRDLLTGALIAHQLEKQGMTCFLEPLSAYRGVLSAYDPDMIVFNHLTAGHLVPYSKKLARLGVLTAVLPNEGIVYDREELQYMAGRHHSGAHIDCFFCWNEAHRDALRECGFGEGVRIEVVGVPRFDFYFAPWSRLFRESRDDGGDKPNVLLCTNFVIARYHELPDIEADKFFAPWKDRIPRYRNYKEAIAVSHRSRARFLDFAGALVGSERYVVTLRPHPSEDISLYERWLAGLPPGKRRFCRLDADSNITSLILACDIEISCETCTTALESWIVGKPTIELVFERHPMFFSEDHAALNVLCESPGDLSDLVEQQLKAPDRKSFAEARKGHLARWCNAPDGTSSRKMAGVIESAISAGEGGKRRSYGANDRRRGFKLKALRKLGLPYHYDPFLPVKERLVGGKYRIKRYGWEKAIRPHDVAEARSLLRSVDPS
jgi:surface carbohydrate biosynthesis protein